MGSSGCGIMTWCVHAYALAGAIAVALGFNNRHRLRVLDGLFNSLPARIN